MKFHISSNQARYFLLQKQFLTPSQSLVGEKGIATVFNSLRLIQYDPLNPCGRNVDLVLQARVEKYHPNDYYIWLYKEKKGIECYDKELCIIPVEDLPFTYHRQIKLENHKRIGPFIKKYKKDLEKIMKLIAKEGPLSSVDINDSVRVDSGWGTDAKFGRIALEALWKIGRLSVVKRENGKKYYDLLSKRYKGSISENKKYEFIAQEHILRRVSSVGILPKTGTGSGWQGLGTGKEVSSIINILLKQKKLIEVAVDRFKQSYVVNINDRSLLERKLDEAGHKIVFIAPLDNLLWDRQMIKDFFNFDYRWEVYTPLLKRKYGYYVLPILYGDTFIGRIEPILNRENNLEIKGLWKEKEYVWDTRVWKEFDSALENFKNYVKASNIIGLKKTK